MSPGPDVLAQGEEGIGRCVRCMCVTCGEGSLGKTEQLVGYFYCVLFLDVAYCLT